MRQSPPTHGVLCCLSLLTFMLACGEPKTPAQLVADLRSPSAQERRRAADDLRTDAGVDPQAVEALLYVVPTERDPQALGAELITLGASGDPRAKPIIDAHINTMDRDMRRWAGRALKRWLLKNGQLPQDYAFPDGWPYGTPGFPPKLPDKD